MDLSRTKRDEGMALIMALMFLVVMGLTATYASSRIMNNARHVDKHVDYQNCFEGIESAFAQAQANFNADGVGFVGVNPNYDFTQGLPNFGDPLVNPVSIPRSPQVQYFAYSFEWANDGVDNNGDGQIDLGPEADGGYISSYAASRVIWKNAPTVIRRAERIFEGVNVNVWQNAIFAGAGQDGLLINGNVSIHGSVHLLGDSLGAGGIALAAMDLSGTSLIHNNYEGLSADARSRIPGLPTTDFEGDIGIETLNATLRVKNGLVGMSGNSEVGQEHVAGNSFKETMDSVYVTDGWTGTAIDVDGNPENVYSDNGWDNKYDLGDMVAFPTYTNDRGRDHLAYYLETDADASVGFQQVYTGDMTFQSGGDSYYWNATTGVEVAGVAPGDEGMPLQADLNSEEYYVWFDGATNTMVVNGRIAVDGDINFLAGNGRNKIINYEGKGTLLALDGGGGGTGNVNITVNLMADAFPDNLLGLMAENILNLGMRAQIEIMGAFYAQDKVIVDRQTNIIGTVVGEYFNMGGQVPSIYQVPALVNAFSGGMRMIGSDTILMLFPVSWRELAVL
ncbi:MAG: hypothetical protein QGD90_05880 [Candidatus Hydrogenedentes bacterium]|nr:hypothetical protein [Candidatus Hydrogenedentota bacterium]